MIPIRVEGNLLATQENDELTVKRELAALVGAIEYEVLIAVPFDRSGRVLGLDVIAMGPGIQSAEPRAVLLGAVRRGAAAMLVARGRTARGATQTDADSLLAERLLSAARRLGIDLTDYLMVDGSSGQSLRALTALWDDSLDDSGSPGNEVL